MASRCPRRHGRPHEGLRVSSADSTPATVRALCLAGPTAAGKTAAALAIARALPVEIISVDSALVYRGMDIGTAKPSLAEQAMVPHHLIDIRDPATPYSAAGFAADATRLIDEIRGRGRVPLLAGGTMLYFKALVEGLDAMPTADAAVRAELDAQAAREGWPALHAELAKVDPPTAARLPPHDAQRIQRALEVWRVSGRPISAWQQRDERMASSSAACGSGSDAGAAGPWSSWPLISLEPADRSWLHRRIAQRLQAMQAAGFLDEVRRLHARGDLLATMPSMRCVGYRQAWEALDDGSAPAMAAWPERAVAATRQLAKRQLTWLRGLPQRRVVVAESDGAVDEVVRLATSAWTEAGNLATLGRPQAS